MYDTGPPSRQTDYSRVSPDTPIVIDNGAATFRIGWAGEPEPRVSFRNVVQRPRHRTTGEVVTVVGDHDPAFMKYFDCTRSSTRSPFDGNVVYQFEYMEYILDYGFERLGASSSKAPQIEHPILMTESICNPSFSRARMAELLFETYGVPSVAFGSDAIFSYKYNQQLGNCDADGLAIYCGHNTCHVIPFLMGDAVLSACCRLNVGGSHITDFLKQLLTLKYPYHMSHITWEKAEELKLEHCYIAPDYKDELKIFQKNTDEAKEKTRHWQLPYIPPPKEVVPSEEDLARKAALKEKQGQRFREMAALKKSQKIAELENKLSGLESLMEELDDADEPEEETALLAQSGYLSRKEIESAIMQVTDSLRKAKGDNVSEDKGLASSAEKYPLVSVPDEMLTPEQLKEKKRQMILKTTTEGKLRAKQKRAEEEALRERLDEEKRTENPEQYFEELCARHKELSEKVDQRKRQKTNGNHNGNHAMPSAIGRGERLNTAQRERMRLLTTAAFDRGKGEDTFGLRDEDWELYKKMSKDNDDDEDIIDDEAELSRLTAKIQDIDPSFLPESGQQLNEPSDFPHLDSLTPEDFNIALGVERFRCPEVLFQPGMIGISQAGLDETVSVSLKRLSSVADTSTKDRMCQSILVTGGSSLLPGLIPRLEAGIRQFRPYHSPLRLVMATDPLLDAWRGAAAYAASAAFPMQMFTLADYNEKGEDWLQRYSFDYTCDFGPLAL